MAARNDLVSKLRARVSDERSSVAAFSVTVTANCKNAYLEIANGVFTVTIEGGQYVVPVRYDLSDSRYNTVGKLMSALDNLTGYAITADPGVMSGHPSIDMQVDGIPDVSNGRSYTLKHRMFADEELNELLLEAISLHNPNYTTIGTVPKPEYPYVIMKAAAQVFRTLASDASKRRGLDTDASTLVRLASDMEDQYSKDMRRQERIVPVPKADESKMGAGDVISGVMSRRSLRAGYTDPYRAALPPQPPDLMDPADDDVEDVLVRLRWSQNREPSFSYWEVWRDTQPKVDRSISGRLTSQNNPSAIIGSPSGPALPLNTQFSRMSTSKQVLGATASRVSPIFDGFFFWTAAELAGSNITNNTFIDGVVLPNGAGSSFASALQEALEPNSTYYYRVYVVNWNGEIVPSRVLKVTTKGLRARFARTGTGLSGVLSGTAVSPTSGTIQGGTTVTVNGTNFPTVGLVVTVGGKPVSNLTIVSSTRLTFTSPAWVNMDFANNPQDIVLTSTNGLVDICQNGWTPTLP